MSKGPAESGPPLGSWGRFYSVVLIHLGLWVGFLTLLASAFR